MAEPCSGAAAWASITEGVGGVGGVDARRPKKANPAAGLASGDGISGGFKVLRGGRYPPAGSL